MSITAVAKNYIKFTGDQDSELIYDSGNLTDSPCMNQLVNLLTGDNEIELPDVDDFVVHGVAIVPPAANDIEPILKGAAVDTGIALSSSNVSVFQFGATPPASVWFEVDEDLSGLRLVWF